LLPGAQEAPLRFAPIVDGWLLPDTPQALAAAGKDNDVPVITGYQANDGGMFAQPVKSPEEYAKLVARQYGEMAAEFLRLYPAATAAEAAEMVATSGRDRERVSMYLWASRRAANHRAPVFTYFFDRAIPWPQHPEFGAFHSGELPYFFLNLTLMDRPWELTDRELARAAAGYLKSFAAQGDPGGSGEKHWQRVSSAEPATMEIGARTSSMPLATKERLEFWTRFFNSPAAAHAPIF
ncbi:MAG: carboxylesterase family protein, partial [Terracidiphilus sp.]